MLIPSNPKLVETVLLQEQIIINGHIQDHNISSLINILREKVYEAYLIKESEFNVAIIKEITNNLSTPKNILQLLIDVNIDFTQPKNIIISKITDICGEYAGRICPYIYALALSNTNSRRSRAGKTFEGVIYKLYETYNLPYVSQGKIGRTHFSDNGLGKLVDSLLPSIDAFKKRRDKVIIGTMKTTLRERWQEVIEEIARTNLPHIYLLTMDKDISKQKAEQMAKHNIILVVQKEIKETDALIGFQNIISFEDYFLKEIPEKLAFWEKLNV